MPIDTPPDLSILIVNWNTRDMTLECLRTVFAQTNDTSFEVVLVDNGSHDGSAEAIAREFPQVQLVAEQTNHGFAAGNNIAAKVARGRRLLLLNTDTLVLDRAIDRIWEFAEAHPKARIWGGRTQFGDGSLNPSSAWRAQSVWSVTCFAFGLSALFSRFELFNVEAMGSWGRDTVREVDIVTGCFLLIDTALWLQLNGFDSSYFMYGEEADLCLRAKDIGARPVINPQATIVHFGGGSAIAKADPLVCIFKAKIKLARNRMSAASAATIRALYLLAAVTRSVGYEFKSRFDASARNKADLWQEVLKRRAEWLDA